MPACSFAHNSGHISATARRWKSNRKVSLPQSVGSLTPCLERRVQQRSDDSKFTQAALSRNLVCIHRLVGPALVKDFEVVSPYQTVRYSDCGRNLNKKVEGMIASVVQAGLRNSVRHGGCKKTQLLQKRFSSGQWYYRQVPGPSKPNLTAHYCKYFIASVLFSDPFEPI